MMFAPILQLRKQRLREKCPCPVTQPSTRTQGSGAPDLIPFLPPHCLCLSPASCLGSEGSTQGFEGRDEFSNGLTEDKETG